MEAARRYIEARFYCSRKFRTLAAAGALEIAAFNLPSLTGGEKNIAQ